MNLQTGLRITLPSKPCVKVKVYHPVEWMYNGKMGDNFLEGSSPEVHELTCVGTPHHIDHHSPYVMCCLLAAMGGPSGGAAGPD